MTNSFWENLLLYLAGAFVSICSILMQQWHERKRYYLERMDKYKLVASEKRLDAHQKAFVHSVQLINIIHEIDEDKRSKVLADAYEFWINHCLYLEKQTRQQFRYCVGLVSMYKTDIQFWREEDDPVEKKKRSEEIQNNWGTIQNLPNIIQEEVALEKIKIETKLTAMGEKIVINKDKKNE
ncbi:MAG: hypothetical protein HUU54_10135 [Ignavibacteriaceae bacterium]|nr:hypothetical protein [Ignavibacteriaceae bacterium]